MKRDVYSGYMKLNGEEHFDTLAAAYNFTDSLGTLGRLKEAKVLLRKVLPVARRVLGESNDLTFKIRQNYACVLYLDATATFDDLREAVTTLEETSRTARRVLGGAHPTVVKMERALRDARAALRARETPPPGSA